MKKILALFLVLASVFSFAIAYNQTDNQEIKKMEMAGEGIARPFYIPNDQLLAVPDEMYPLLCEAAKESKVNIFRTNIRYNKNDQAEIIKYMFLTGDTSFFSSFRLKSGRFLTVIDTQGSNYYISTADTGDKNQIGIIKDFGGNNYISVKPLKVAYESLPVDGQYFVETHNNQEYNVFIKNFVNNINEHYQKYLKIPYTIGNFEKISNSGGSEMRSDTIILEYTKYMIFAITLLLFIYYIFYESKQIGIMKMHGLSNFRIWYIIVGKMITLIFVLSAVVSLLVAMLIKDTTVQFVGSTIICLFKAYVIVTITSLVSYLYISRIRISSEIKNRKDTNGIFAINTLVKAGCSILVILIVLSILTQYTDIRVKQENLRSWGQSKDYGVFYPTMVGDDMEDTQHGSPKETVAEAVGLYPILNRMGTIFIDATDYEENSLILNKDYQGIRSIKVNPNYLRKFPVFDSHDKPVQISEDTSDWILLVPEKYHNREKEILDFFHKERKGSKDYQGIYGAEEKFFRRAVQDNVKNQQIKIVWLVNNQKIFSFNPEVFPTENNVIIDPVIQVITEKNSLCADRANMISGGGGSDPLKVRLINRDPALTLKTLEPELKRLKLDDNLKYLITADQFVLKTIYDLQIQMRQLLFTSIGLIVALLLLMIQNLTIFFKKYQNKFVVRRLFGLGFIRTYKEYIWLFLITWTFQVIICYFVNRGLISGILQKAAKVSTVATAIENSTGTGDIKLFAVAAGLMLIELAASVIALMVIERKNKVKVLKGGV